MAKGKELAKFTQDLPPWAKGVVAIAALGGGYLLVRKLTKKAAESETEGTPQSKSVGSEITQLSKTQKLSYPVSQYTAYANKLKQAFYGYGTDESAVFDVFGAMKNDLDVATLIKAFGVYSVEASIWRPFDTRGSGDLATWLTDEMSDSDIQTINQGLAKKGIKYKF